MTNRRNGFQAYAVLVDVVAAAAAYRLAGALPLPASPGGDALASAPAAAWLVVGVQMAGLTLAGVYWSLPIPQKIGRLVVGAGAATAVAGLAASSLLDVPVVSPVHLVVDGVFLVALATGWRAGRVLWATRRRQAPMPAFVDRATERSSPLEMLADVVRGRELLRNLVHRDLKLKYRGSVLGFFWSLLNPLAMVFAYTLAFQYILRTGRERFALFVMVGVLAWRFFASSSMMATGAMIGSSGLLASVRFPRAILPLSTVLFNLAQYLLILIVLLPLMFLVYGHPPAWAMLGFPLVLVLQTVFNVGLAMMLSVVTVFFRDVRHLVEVTLMVMFWTTPVIYSLDQIGNETLRGLIQLNPVSPFVVASQQMLFDGVWPDPTTWILATVYALMGLAIGGIVFLSLEDRVAEEL